MNNDTLNYLDGSLDNIPDTLASEIDTKKIFFFTSASLKVPEKCLCDNLDEFVQKVRIENSTTWIEVSHALGG